MSDDFNMDEFHAAFDSIKNSPVPFTDDDKKKLIEYYENDELNKYTLIIVLKILEVKNFTEDRTKVIPYLTARIADAIPTVKNFNQDPIFIAEIIYKSLITINVTEIGNISF